MSNTFQVTQSKTETIVIRHIVFPQANDLKSKLSTSGKRKQTLKKGKRKKTTTKKKNPLKTAFITKNKSKHRQNAKRKLLPCDKYEKGECVNGVLCSYMHQEFPCTYFYLGVKCPVENCKFLHNEPLPVNILRAFIKHVKTLKLKELIPNKPKLKSADVEVIVNRIQIELLQKKYAGLEYETLASAQDGKQLNETLNFLSQQQLDQLKKMGVKNHYEVIMLNTWQLNALGIRDGVLYQKIIDACLDVKRYQEKQISLQACNVSKSESLSNNMICQQEESACKTPQQLSNENPLNENVLNSVNKPVEISLDDHVTLARLPKEQFYRKILERNYYVNNHPFPKRVRIKKIQKFRNQLKAVQNELLNMLTVQYKSPKMSPNAMVLLHDLQNFIPEENTDRNYQSPNQAKKKLVVEKNTSDSSLLRTPSMKCLKQGNTRNKSARNLLEEFQKFDDIPKVCGSIQTSDSENSKNFEKKVNIKTANTDDVVIGEKFRFVLRKCRIMLKRLNECETTPKVIAPTPKKQRQLLSHLQGSSKDKNSEKIVDKETNNISPCYSNYFNEKLADKIEQKEDIERSQVSSTLTAKKEDETPSLCSVEIRNGVAVIKEKVINSLSENDGKVIAISKEENQTKRKFQLSAEAQNSIESGRADNRMETKTKEKNQVQKKDLLIAEEKKKIDLKEKEEGGIEMNAEINESELIEKQLDDKKEGKANKQRGKKSDNEIRSVSKERNEVEKNSQLTVQDKTNTQFIGKQHNSLRKIEKVEERSTVVEENVAKIVVDQLPQSAVKKKVAKVTGRNKSIPKKAASCLKNVRNKKQAIFQPTVVKKMHSKPALLLTGNEKECVDYLFDEKTKKIVYKTSLLINKHKIKDAELEGEEKSAFKAQAEAELTSTKSLTRNEGDEENKNKGRERSPIKNVTSTAVECEPLSIEKEKAHEHLSIKDTREKESILQNLLTKMEKEVELSAEENKLVSIKAKKNVLVRVKKSKEEELFSCLGDGVQLSRKEKEYVERKEKQTLEKENQTDIAMKQNVVGLKDHQIIEHELEKSFTNADGKQLQHQAFINNDDDMSTFIVKKLNDTSLVLKRIKKTDKKSGKSTKNDKKQAISKNQKRVKHVKFVPKVKEKYLKNLKPSEERKTVGISDEKRVEVRKSIATAQNENGERVPTSFTEKIKRLYSLKRCFVLLERIDAKVPRTTLTTKTNKNELKIEQNNKFNVDKTIQIDEKKKENARNYTRNKIEHKSPKDAVQNPSSKRTKIEACLKAKQSHMKEESKEKSSLSNKHKSMAKNKTKSFAETNSKELHQKIVKNVSQKKSDSLKDAPKKDVKSSILDLFKPIKTEKSINPAVIKREYDKCVKKAQINQSRLLKYEKILASAESTPKSFLNLSKAEHKMKPQDDVVKKQHTISNQKTHETNKTPEEDLADKQKIMKRPMTTDNKLFKISFKIPKLSNSTHSKDVSLIEKLNSLDNLQIQEGKSLMEADLCSKLNDKVHKDIFLQGTNRSNISHQQINWENVRNLTPNQLKLPNTKFSQENAFNKSQNETANESDYLVLDLSDTSPIEDCDDDQTYISDKAKSKSLTHSSGFLSASHNELTQEDLHNWDEEFMNINTEKPKQRHSTSNLKADIYKKAFSTYKANPSEKFVNWRFEQFTPSYCFKDRCINYLPWVLKEIDLSPREVNKPTHLKDLIMEKNYFDPRLRCSKPFASSPAAKKSLNRMQNERNRILLLKAIQSSDWHSDLSSDDKHKVTKLILYNLMRSLTVYHEKCEQGHTELKFSLNSLKNAREIESALLILNLCVNERGEVELTNRISTNQKEVPTNFDSPHMKVSYPGTTNQHNNNPPRKAPFMRYGFI